MRILGVALTLLKSNFTERQRTFVMLSNIPKATVQASVGALPLLAGIMYGQEMLTFSTMAILITAPIGAILILNVGPKLLEKDKS